MKKRLVLILIIMILINAIIPKLTYAVEGEEAVEGAIDKINSSLDGQGALDHQAETGHEMNEERMEKGTSPLTPSNGQTRTEKLGETKSSSSSVAGVLCGILALPANAVTGIMNLVVKLGNGDINSEFTIENLVFNKLSMFNIDFFTYDSNSSAADITLKKSIAEWYYGLRNLAIAANVVILIYIGIRMAISTVAAQKAKYIKMFNSWVFSFMLLFVMHYIIIIMIAAQDWVLGVVDVFVEGQGFEEIIIDDSWTAINNARGWSCVSTMIQLYVIVFYQIKFFLAYFKRFFSTAFLLIISPLVTITYSIDAAGDGKAQAYGNWIKQITYNIFIQAVHAIVYAIFIISAAEIAKQIPIFGAILLMTLSRTEKVVKNTMKMSGKGIADEKVLERIKGMKK